MNILPESVSRLIEEFSRLPGIGPKSAQRLAFHLLKRSSSRNQALGEAVLDLKEGVMRCSTCCCLTSQAECVICQDASRDRDTLCVVESTLDLIALEKTSQYRGLYHVLQGRLSPLDGVGPEDLRIAELFKRMTGDAAPKEVILALNPDLEGDTTALFLQKKLEALVGEDRPLRVSRIARGIPSGGHLEYTDEATLIRALEGRQLLS